TDYEFQGYTQEKKSDDELYRYEETTFNKFYTETEKDVAFLEGKDLQNFDRVDESLFRKQYLVSENPESGYENERRIVICVQDDYRIDKIWIEEAPNFFDIVKNVDIYVKGAPIDTDITTDGEIITIDLKDTYSFLDIVIKMNYETEGAFEFKTKILRNNGRELRHKIELTSDFKSVTIYSLILSEFQEFIRKNYFTFYEVLPYYYFERTFYKHYNIERTYYKDSEEASLEGYIYDPKESYTMYKEYKREKIEDPEEDSKKDEDLKNPDEPKGDEDNSETDKKEPNESEKSKDTTIIPEPVRNYITNVYKYESKKDESVNENADTEKTDETSDITCNCNFQMDGDYEKESVACKENLFSKTSMILGGILIIIAGIEIVIYGFSVKHRT
ncbi:MAG TPA: hypothetical protein DCY94_00705, partial [Firmicutes bacterium]|nr:hypothetical protein [Bacillota bacterium]